MIEQNINPLKYMLNFMSVIESEIGSTRLSMIEPVLLLLINGNPDSSKSDLVTILSTARVERKRTSLDRPLLRLIELGYIEDVGSMSVSTKKGEARTAYRVTRAGDMFLKACSSKIKV